MDSTRRFNNELAAFKEGKTIQHDEGEVVKIPENQKKSFIKLSLILVVLTVIGYYLIKLPLSKQSISTNGKNIEQALNFDSYALLIQERFPDWMKNEELISQLYTNSVSIRTISLINQAKKLDSTSLNEFIAIERFIDHAPESNDQTIVEFLNHFAPNDLTIAHEAGVDISNCNAINTNTLFETLSFDDITLLASIDTQGLLKSFKKNSYTEKLTQSDWLLIAEKGVNSNFIDSIYNAVGDFSSELSVNDVVQLSSKNIQPDIVIKALQSSDKKQIDELLVNN
ncbi:hypothetical protein EP331_12580 [bacterium]|nr:MAG: hypothetical protein EP331_12580 [bacterium]